MSAPEVSICIPAWQAEKFIDETLWFARRQTHENIRILVSADLGDDRTADIARTHARDDRRVEVVAQRERLGWAGNVNFLLERVASEYFFIYFHDDFIDPTYTQRLLQRILERPDAACAQCDVLNVRRDGSRRLTEGRDHVDRAAERLVACLLDPEAGGAVIRGLMRSRIVRGVRFATSSTLSLFAYLPFLLQVFAAGPILHVPRVLYWRPDRRHGGLVDTWKNASVAEVVLAQRVNAEASLRAIREARLSVEDREVVEFALQLNVMAGVRGYEHRHRSREIVPPAAISSAFRFASPPASLHRLSQESRRLVMSGYRLDALREIRHDVREGRFADATARIRSLGTLNVVRGVASRMLRRPLGTFRAKTQDVPDFLQRRLDAAPVAD